MGLMHRNPWLACLILAHLIFAAIEPSHALSDRYSADAKADHVPILPGANAFDMNFNLFSGYVTVDDNAGRALFYTLAESSSDTQETDPLILWVNGGPGCASTGGGFLSELGPFYPTPPDGTVLIPNEYAWNKEANVIFLDSPAFVGFSYSNASADLTVGDDRTARDSLQFLLGFLERFPQYKGRPFWLSGESYAGHYTPNFALEILHHNKKTNSNDVNFKGFLVGNPLTDPTIENEQAVRFWWGHGIISTSTLNGMLDNCDFANVGPLAATLQLTAMLPPRLAAVEGARRAAGRSLLSKHSTGTAHLQGIGSKESRCDAYILKSAEEFTDRVNIYDIYADVCLPSNSTTAVQQLALMSLPVAKRQAARLLLKQQQNARRQSQNNKPLTTTTTTTTTPPKYDPCVDNEVENYFNRKDVQQALHVATTTSQPLPVSYVICNPHIDYSYDDVLTSMLPVYDELINEHDIKILVYSGDIDAILPIAGTRVWIESLDLDEVEAWRAWQDPSGQIGGWVVEYEQGLTFASVRGGGHMAPYTSPERSSYLFNRWIHGRQL